MIVTIVTADSADVLIVWSADAPVIKQLFDDAGLASDSMTTRPDHLGCVPPGLSSHRADDDLRPPDAR